MAERATQKNIGTSQSNQSSSQYQNIFTATDHAIVRKAIAEVLDEKECQAVLLRFWKNELLEDIGVAMHLPVSTVEMILHRAFIKLKNFCQSTEIFSRR